MYGLLYSFNHITWMDSPYQGRVEWSKILLLSYIHFINNSNNMISNYFVWTVRSTQRTQTPSTDLILNHLNPCLLKITTMIMVNYLTWTLKAATVIQSPPYNVKWLPCLCQHFWSSDYYIRYFQKYLFRVNWQAFLPKTVKW